MDDDDEPVAILFAMYGHVQINMQLQLACTLYVIRYYN